ncbi:NAD-dependent methanol dehydrogenase [Andreprevotia sp. IGB-42]|uniref:iron-containing alcohol dehydrogenase PsrA n=1 Tax=Andreprevotia sp. IGB-42 TaxID=2497473 RepID=UPI00135C2F93|nr:iron-containing alcohol dehydrogenase PsrA [Andreprevotia sp. IGB-42]KAF0813886.1 NAD-dependent methanol dehydrogenase [Andreprevotia sp. IGB-42]
MWLYNNPVAIHAGNGCLDTLPALLGERRAILIAFPEAAALGLVERVQALLGERLLAVETSVQANPDIVWLAPMYERLWRDYPQAECVIALGGGSSIDCAKAMLTATPSGRFDELLAHLNGAPLAQDGQHRALIAIPTTAGTGSEVTPWATLWDAAGGRKHSLHLPWTWPEAALIDPELMLSLPRNTTLASALDALSHALESLWNVHRNPVSAALAVSAARIIVATLPALMRDPQQLVLREKLAFAALLAGMAFSNTKTALAHSLSYDITLQHGTAHGIACSFSLPRILRLALGRDAALDAQLLAIFDASSADTAVEKLNHFLAELGVSTDPADYGIAPRDWDGRVAQALAGPRGKNFINASGI